MQFNTHKLLFCLCLLTGFLVSTATRAEGNKKDNEKTPYGKIFKTQKVDKATGPFANVYLVGGKVYVELPVSKLNKNMLLSSTISAVSEPSVLTIGTLTQEPLYVKFSLVDSTLVMKSLNTMATYNRNRKDLQHTAEVNFFDPSVASFKIEAYNNDSTAFLFDFSRFVTSVNDMIDIIPKKMGDFTLSSSPKSGLNFAREVKAFDNNISVRTDFTYSISASLMQLISIASNIPVTVSITFNLMELPASSMRPRIADSRVGTGFLRKMKLPEDDEGIKPVYYAHRWNLIPSDIQAYKAGKLTTPAKPIVFYLDPAFPESWKAPIRKGVLRWNKAFEKIGFKEVIQIKDFPTDDPDFDPYNFAYNCIRYIPSATENAVAQTCVNPQTGEILGASISVYNNLPELIRQWRFVQTAAVDPKVRSLNLPQDEMNEGISSVIAHETGVTLGLVPNYAASSAYSTKLLRDAKFTRENGISPSIMDYARYNYIAQPEDKGVSLTLPELGPYDYFAIAWNYTYFADDITDKQQEKTLEHMVDTKAKDARFRFAQKNKYDPTVQSDDLGNDPILSAELGAKNIKRISNNLGKWIQNDDDSRIKDKYNLLLAQQLHRYLKNVLALIGGIQINNSKEGTGVPRIQVVSKARQAQAVQWSLNFIKQFTSYANRPLERKGYLAVSYYDQLIEFIVTDFITCRHNVLVSSFLDSKSYTQADFYNDAFNNIFAGLTTGRTLSPTEKFLQTGFTEMAILSIGTGKPSGSSAPNMPSLSGFNIVNGFHGDIPAQIASTLSVRENSFGDPTVNIIPNLNLKLYDQSGMILLDMLKRLQPQLKQAIARASNNSMRAHYSLLLFKINKALNPNNFQ